MRLVEAVVVFCSPCWDSPGCAAPEQSEPSETGAVLSDCEWKNTGSMPQAAHIGNGT